MKTIKVITAGLLLAIATLPAANAQTTATSGLAIHRDAEITTVLDENHFVKKTEPGQTVIYSANNAGRQTLTSDKISIRWIRDLKEEENSLFAGFEIKSAAGKNYLHWEVSNDAKNGIFVVERSDNGVDFEIAGFKNRVNSIIPLLSYYFSENDTEKLLVYYRVLAIGEDGTYKYSEVKTAGIPVIKRETSFPVEEESRKNTEPLQ